MKINRRNMLKLLAASAPAAYLPGALAQSTSSPTNSNPAPTNSPGASLDNLPTPPAPAPIPAPAGFGVAPGPFQPTWDSLSNYQSPDWYRDAKLGIWAHWGPQSQPEMGDWYAQHMYLENNPIYRFHCARYGHPSKFGFKDVIHTWQAEEWDPDHLVQFYKKAGAKIFAAMACHHDNLDLFNSKFQPWNSVNVGPKKDIIGGWARAARKAGTAFRGHVPRRPRLELVPGRARRRYFRSTRRRAV